MNPFAHKTHRKSKKNVGYSRFCRREEILATRFFFFGCILENRELGSKPQFETTSKKRMGVSHSFSTCAQSLYPEIVVDARIRESLLEECIL